MITRLFRTLATPLTVVLDYVLAARQMRALFEYVDDSGDDLDLTGHREVP
jgi:hypothetical protein